MDEKKGKRARVWRLVDEARAAGLAGADWCVGLGVDRVAEEYNGIGPEFLTAAVRDRATAHLALFEPAALIHDCRVGASDELSRGNSTFMVA